MKVKSWISQTPYWVEWSCEGNDFVASYATAEERDERAVELRAEEAKGRWEEEHQTSALPYAHTITTGKYGS